LPGASSVTTARYSWGAAEEIDRLFAWARRRRRRRLRATADYTIVDFVDAGLTVASLVVDDAFFRGQEVTVNV